MSKTIEQLLRQSAEVLIGVGTDDKTARLEVAALLSYILVKPKSYLLTWPNELLKQGQLAMFEVLLERRVAGEPLAYITGEKEFFSLIFKVTPNTLIPRPETELLVETVLEKFKANKNDQIQLLDLGTGTGAIAVSLAKTRNQWHVTAVDKSLEALEVAKYNANLHNVNNIDFVSSHWFNNLDCNLKFDCIVSNPPYIASNDPHLNELKFEPQSALVASNNGLRDIEEILSHARSFLKPGGFILIEHGYEQLPAIVEIVKELKILNSEQDLISINDYAGLPRLVMLKNIIL